MKPDHYCVHYLQKKWFFNEIGIHQILNSLLQQIAVCLLQIIFTVQFSIIVIGFIHYSIFIFNKVYWLFLCFWALNVHNIHVWVVQFPVVWDWLSWNVKGKTMKICWLQCDRGRRIRDRELWDQHRIESSRLNLHLSRHLASNNSQRLSYTIHLHQHSSNHKLLLITLNMRIKNYCGLNLVSVLDFHQ